MSDNDCVVDVSYWKPTQFVSQESLVDLQGVHRPDLGSACL